MLQKGQVVRVKSDVLDEGQPSSWRGHTGHFDHYVQDGPYQECILNMITMPEDAVAPGDVGTEAAFLASELEALPSDTEDRNV